MAFKFDKEETITELEKKIESIRNMDNPSEEQVQLGRLYKTMLIELVGSEDEYGEIFN
jgi:hypothetical protein